MYYCDAPWPYFFSEPGDAVGKVVAMAPDYFRRGVLAEGRKDPIHVIYRGTAGAIAPLDMLVTPLLPTEYSVRVCSCTKRIGMLGIELTTVGLRSTA